MIPLDASACITDTTRLLPPERTLVKSFESIADLDESSHLEQATDDGSATLEKSHDFDMRKQISGMETSAFLADSDFRHYIWCAEREADRLASINAQLAGVNAQLMSQVSSLRRQVSDADREVRC